MTKILIISDLHSGHLYGLTPTSYQRGDPGALQFQKALWRFFSSEIKKLRPIDVLVVNGDAIQGKDVAWGGRELITADRHEQVRIAAEAINAVKAPVVHLTYGTRYHVGGEEDFESILLDLIEAEEKNIHGHLFLKIENVVFDIKHKIGRSTVPHGRFTPLFRTAVWNALWAEVERQPKADIIVRSHVHYYDYCGDRERLALITPALTYNSAYGIRECEGTVDVGIVVFIVNKDRYSYLPIFFDSPLLKANVHQVRR